MTAKAAIKSKYLMSGKLLQIGFSQECRTASWAIHGGGIKTADGVAWMQVCNDDIRPPVDPRHLLQQTLEDHQLHRHVGLMTSAMIANATHVEQSFGPLHVSCTATVGLGNSMRAGDNPSPSGRIGTINMAIESNVAMSDEALLEGLALMTEAKTVAMMEARIKSYLTGAWASGTGTDCAVIAAPVRGHQEVYCGKHTKLGHLIGHCTYEAVRQGIDIWKGNNPGHKLLGSEHG